jgi:AbrB family looped-hinge helix DNA binding protein
MGGFTTLSSKGQLTIPKDVRAELNLTEGTRFFVTVRNGEVVALPKNRRISDLAGIMGKPPKGLGASLDDIDDAIGRAVAEEDERITREWKENGVKKG